MDRQLSVPPTSRADLISPSGRLHAPAPAGTAWNNARESTPVRALRVVLVAHSTQLGGIERHVVTLASELIASGAQVAYAGPMSGWLGAQMRPLAHACLDLPMRGMFDALSAWRLARFARHFQASVLHGHAMRGARYADWASGWSGVPAVMTAHSTIAWKWFTRQMRLIAVSHAVRDSLVTRGFLADRITVVHNGAPDAVHSRAGATSRSSTGWRGSPSPARPFRIGLIGRLVPDKGHDLALQAAAELRAQIPLELVFAGPDDMGWSHSLRAQARQLGLVGHVDFAGISTDVPGLLASLDLVIAPSRREALSLALIETAAAGLPCVASRIGGIPEVVEHGKTGWLTPPGDTAALARAIQSLATDPNLRQAFGTAARRRYEVHFRAADMCAQTRAIYDTVVRAGAANHRPALA